ncbi:sulfatase [Marinoscillum sp.]|uniref:sulfatase n=1 Tax=Marinoscillum sp. TaxID=2024838 RepID=UPI003BAA39BF
MIRIGISLMCLILLSCQQETKKLNVLFILADDLGAHDLSFAGSEFYESPNIDRLANQGVIFTNGYAAAQVCSPSRASILTGQTTVSHGVTDWIGAESGSAWGERVPYTKLLPPDYQHQLPASDITMPELFQMKGYKTFFAGKWHLGSQGSWPEDHGFDVNVGGWDYGNPKGGYFSPYDNPNLTDGSPGENLSMRLAEETAGFIRTNKGEPFFAMLSFYAVHGPIQTTREYWEKYRNKALEVGLDSSGFQMERRLPIRTVQDNAIYAGLIQHMDDAVGLVLDELESQGLLEHTVVIFTSDNGGVASGDAYSTTNSPLRGGKGYQWEGGIRVPYVIKVPGVAPAIVDYPVSGQDFYPTICALAGLEIPAQKSLDGVNLESALRNTGVKDRSLVWHYPHYGNQGGDPVSMLRKGRYKLIYYWEANTSELYDLEDDIGEQYDLAPDQPEMVNALEQELFEYLKGKQAKMPEPNPFYSAEALERRQTYVREKLLPSLEKNRLKILEDNFQPNEDWWGSTTKD